MAVTVGSQKLKAAPGTQLEKAKALGANRSLIQFWMTGARTPNASWARRLDQVYGIREPDWSTEYQQVSHASAQEPELDPSDIVGGGRAQLSRIALMRKTIEDPRLAVRLEETERACRHTLAIYLGEGRAVTESVLLRSPAFARVMVKITAALRNHPDALLDVTEALENGD